MGSDLISGDGNRLLKFPALLAMLSLLGYWSAYQGLIRDLIGVGPMAKSKPRDLSRTQRLLIYGAAYLWTDMVAGMTHLMFDFCPRYYPVIGDVARGFQFHHYHPSAWTVVPFFTMLSHSFLLLGALSVALALLPPRRVFRAFWALTYLLCLLTVVTHRWVHFPEDENYWWCRALQRIGLLMSNGHHLQHHESLVTQFSNLSGITDFILDAVTKYLLPPTMYHHWMMATMIWFAIPMIVGLQRLRPQGTQIASRLAHKEDV